LHEVDALIKVVSNQSWIFKYGEVFCPSKTLLSILINSLQQE